jgi:hypothetical protein
VMKKYELVEREIPFPVVLTSNWCAKGRNQNDLEMTSGFLGTNTVEGNLKHQEELLQLPERARTCRNN